MKVTEAIKEQIEERNSMLKWIERNFPNIDELDLHSPPSFYNERIDFDCLTHEQVVKVMLTLGGKWDKKPNGTKFDYTRTEEIDDWGVRLWMGEPPPSCRLVTETIEVPATFIPAHTETRTKLICNETNP